MGDLTRDVIQEKLDAIQAKDHYRLLGVPRTAHAGEVKAAYFALVKQYHPDRVRTSELASQAAQVFRELSAAHAVLSDTAKRAAYDRTLTATEAPPRQDPRAADEELARLLETPPESFGEHRVQMARVFHVRGAALFSRGDLDGAERYMRKAVALDTQPAEYHLRLGFTLLANPRLPEAVRLGESRTFLERAVAGNPYSADARYSMATYWKAVGKRDQYRRELEAALRCPGGHAKAEFELNLLLRAEANGRPAGGSDAIPVRRGGSDAVPVRRGGSDAVPVRRGGSDAVPVRRGGSDAVPVRRGGSDAVPVRRGGSDAVPLTRGASDVVVVRRPDGSELDAPAVETPKKSGFSFSRWFGKKGD